MRIAALLTCAWFATAAGAPGQTGQRSDPATPPFSITITAAQDAVKVGSPVVIRIVLTNTSDRQLKLTHVLTDQGDMYKIDVWDSQNHLVQQAKPRTWKDKNGRLVRQIRGGASVTLLDLEPGQTLKEACPVDKRYDLTQPGEYSVQASRYDYETKTWVKSNTITVTVTP